MDEVVVAGLATDYCVTADGAGRRSGRLCQSVNLPLSAGINAERVEKTLAEFSDNGIDVIK